MPKQIKAHTMGHFDTDAEGDPMTGNDNNAALFTIVFDPTDLFVPGRIFSSRDFTTTLHKYRVSRPDDGWPQGMIVLDPHGQKLEVRGRKLVLPDLEKRLAETIEMLQAANLEINRLTTLLEGVLPENEPAV